MSQLVLSLMEQGIYLTISKGDLIYKSLSGEPKSTSLALLKQHKVELLDFYKGIWQSVNHTDRQFPERGDFEIAPLSFSQERLWLNERLGAEEQIGQYNITGACRLEGRVDISAIEQALEALVARQPVLRTIILQDADLGVMQVVRENTPLLLQQQDLSGDPQAAKAEQQLIQQESARPFDLERDMMLRVNLLKRSEIEYVLVFTMHHIVSDGWSMNLLIDEFGTLYNAYAQRREAALPPLPLLYTDYARWQRYVANENTDQKKQHYWKAQLAGIPPVHNVPLDFSRPAKQRFHGAARDTLIAPEQVALFEVLCRQHDATLFMGLHAVFAVLLARYSGEKDIVMGTPIANRERLELEALIGFFVNMMVLRIDLSSNPTFEQLLARSKTCISDAFAHAQPFGYVVDAVQTERSLSYSPIFQIVISLQSNTHRGAQLNGVNIQTLPVTRDSVKYDLVLDFAPSADGLRLTWEYNTDLFSTATIAGMAEHFATLFCQVTATPTAELFGLSLLGEHEKTRLLTWGNAQSDVRRVDDKTLIDFLRQQVVLRPQAIALMCDQASISYGELGQWVENAAFVLRYQGIKPGNVVGVCAEKSFEWVASMFAIWQCGAVYLPIAPNTPSARVDYMLNDAAASLLLFDQAGAPAAEVQATSLAKMSLEALLRERGVARQEAPQAPWDNAAIAYLLYTSGTTGRPKGVLISHANAVSVLDGVADLFDIAPDTVMPAIASAAFDISLFEVVMPLMRGGQVMLYRHHEVTDIPRLVSDIDHWTSLHAVPALMNAILDECDLKRLQPVKLRQLFVGGDSVSNQILQRLKTTFATQQIVELYGPTEGTILSTANLINEPVGELKGAVIGHPLPHARIYILDEEGNLTPQGVAGQLCIGGAGVAVGYLNRDEENHRRFIHRASPAAASEYERLYHTGDIARWRSDGNLEFLGRNDSQVKLRGYRIELAEIEALLCQRSDIKQALVVVQNRNDNPCLVAYIIGEGADDPKTLRHWLAKQLPDYMVPSAYCKLASLPLTVNGKVDRSRLPEVAVHTEVAETTPLRNERERELCRIWEHVLGVPNVGIYDDFFAIGGHSLAAIKIDMICRQTLKVDVPLSLIFEHKTIANISAFIAEKQDVITIPHVEQQRHPLSLAQEQMLFTEELGKGGSAYHIHYFSPLDNDADIPALIEAINRTAERHPVLKSVYLFGDNNEYEQVRLDGDIEVLHQAVDGEDALHSAVEACIAAPFDLGREPGLRVRTWSVGNTNYLLLLFHHIAFDGWSERVFMFELAQIYQALIQRNAVTMADPVISYGDYARWERNLLADNGLESFNTFWRTQLAGISPLSLPLDYPRPAFLVHDGKIYNVDFSYEKYQILKTVAREESTTLYAVLLSAFFLTLSSICEQNDIVIGTPSDNRDLPQVREVVGLFANTLALRSRIQPEMTLSDYIAGVHQLITHAKSHQQLPFGKVAEMIAGRPDPSIHPVYQVTFSVIDAVESKKWQQWLPIDFETSRKKRALYNPAKLDLSLDLVDSGDHMYGGFTYATSLMTEQTVIMIAERLKSILAGLADKRERRIHTLLTPWLKQG
ncbi:non-ribosomal peptide synthetase [Dickeya paradisiaca]